MADILLKRLYSAAGRAIIVPVDVYFGGHGGAGRSSADQISPHDWASGRRRIASAYTRKRRPKKFPFSAVLLRSAGSGPSVPLGCREHHRRLIGGGFARAFRAGDCV